MENSAITATAWRGVLGILATRAIATVTGGDDETTYPPTITITICIVKGIRAQKLLPPSIAIFAGVSPVETPIRNTITTPRNAKTRGSGNQRSLQFANARPVRPSHD